MLINTAAIDQNRLAAEASRWGRCWDADVKSCTLHGDWAVTTMIEIELSDGSRYVSTGEGDFGIGSEYIQFTCVGDSDNNPRFFLNGL